MYCPICSVLFDSVWQNFSFPYGHLKLSFSIPYPNQIFDSADLLASNMVITFTERPELQDSKIYVIDYKKERIDNHDLRMGLSEKSLSLTLDKSKMVAGMYTVKWMVLSEDDGFITKGLYTFSLVNISKI